MTSVRAMVLVMMVGLPCCTASPEEVPDGSAGAPLPDGFYALAAEEGRAGVEGQASRRVPRVPVEADAPPPEDVSLREPAIVPLALRAEPQWVVAEDGRPRILLSLSPECSEALRDHTRDHVGEQVAVVIGGEAVSLHKVREPIEMPELAISACGEGILERLWQSLQERPRP